MTYAKKTQGERRQSAANAVAQKRGASGPTLQFVDNRPKTAAQQMLQKAADTSQRVAAPGSFQGSGLHPLEQLDSITKNLEQNVGTEGKLMPMYIQAWKVVFEELKPKVEEVARRVKGLAKIAPLKEMSSAKRKIEAEYAGQSNKVVDIGRASITCKTASQAIEAYREIEKSFNVVRVKNRFKTPVGGYRDMLLNVELKHGHIAEIQIHLEEIIAIKEVDGHELYEIIRVLEAKERDGTITPEEVTEMNRAKTEMKRIYDAAWERAKAVPDK